MNYHRAVFPINLIISLFILQGHCATQHDFQTWSNVTLTGSFDKKSKAFNRFKYWLENQERIGEDSTHFSQTLLRTGAGYMLTENTSIWAGYAFIHTGAPFTARAFTENRIWQQLLWIKKISANWSLLSRTRTEQRFLENNNKTVYRIRQLLKGTRVFNHYPGFSLIASDEVFWHKNDFIGRNGQGLDQNRFFAGMGYAITPKITTEIGYMNQYIRRFGVPDFLTNILSINLFMNF